MSELVYAGDVNDSSVAEVVEERTWDERVDAFIGREQSVLEHRFQNAREVFAVGREYGSALVESFAKDVGISRTAAYEMVRVWRTFGEYYEADTLPSNVYWTSYVLAAHKSGDPVGAIIACSDGNMSTRQFEAYVEGGFSGRSDFSPESPESPRPSAPQIPAGVEAGGGTTPSRMERDPEPAGRPEALYLDSDLTRMDERVECEHCAGTGWRRIREG